MTEDVSQITLPGQLLATSSQNSAAGQGAYSSGSRIFASLSGLKTPSSDGADQEIGHFVSVQTRPKTLLPHVGGLVLARIIRITPRQAVVNILAVSDSGSAVGKPRHTSSAIDVLRAHYIPASSSSSEFQGLIRQQDIRATEKDKVKVSESFRPGDVVRAVVISLGDQRDYYLSTAGYVPEAAGGSGRKIEGNELGVVLATSESGNVMLPVSWKECRDPVTGLSEPRKVARPG